ncbi:MFS transporter [Paenibacillus allorhizosphaerae]|uniref:Fosmidomycin resistance protein n=1 Tax=Paenibacillus allorhizosphaerae TaxID=2849866 RepID=A0ABM8VA52_9BACL|nr:MFS transporter [Paenibacillus allorhizosphaerae]CAG7615409.1 Fosmidomycin resistance protein [Paenibacillus allorhizosphaerae]
MPTERNPNPTVYPILLVISIAHLINDSLQAVIPASYPILRDSLHLSYTQLGLITFILYFSSSVMQPFVGAFADTRPTPYILPSGMLLSLFGMLGLAYAPGYVAVLCSVILVGTASAMFHPEGARIAYLAAGSKRGFAQSLFQVGGNAGSAMAPLMTALIFYPFGQKGAVWFTLVAAAGAALQMWVARWYKDRLLLSSRGTKSKSDAEGVNVQQQRVVGAIVVIILIAFARSLFGSSVGTYFVFYLMEQFRMSVPEAQMYIFLYAGAGIVGTFLGGPLSDRIGRKAVMLLSVLGAAPFGILLPYAGELWLYPLLMMLGLINHSSFSVTVVYVQELVPGKIGMVSGLITGLAFGMGAIGTVVVGAMIDLTSLSAVIVACTFMPLFGVIGFLLPSDRKFRNRPEGMESKA